MATKKKNVLPEKTCLCHICGKVISGDHVYIRTRRKSDIHIHFDCIEGEKKKGGETA